MIIAIYFLNSILLSTQFHLINNLMKIYVNVLISECYAKGIIAKKMVVRSTAQAWTSPPRPSILMCNVIMSKLVDYFLSTK